MRVCLIDDDAASLNALRLIVKRAGHAVKTYLDPLAAVDDFSAAVASGERLPDAVLTDQTMPGMDGMTVVRRRVNFRRWRAAIAILWWYPAMMMMNWPVQCWRWS